ncbi:MAG: hypothetical protein ABIQ39_10070 [Ilumatobacteraceae bacterium]
MNIDRRAVFFLMSGGLSLLLLALCPPDLRWVGWVLAIVFVILALGSWIDHVQRRDRRRRRP